ncbi:MAG: DUF5916 domain-containing protein [Candidatus Krumholzibacteriia bacterium]
MQRHVASPASRAADTRIRDRSPGSRSRALLIAAALVLIAAGAVPRPARADAADPAAATHDCSNGYLATLADTVRAVRVTSPVKVDGVLDEAAWDRPPAGPLVQNDPDNGCPPRHATDWWVAYDAENLYVAARCHDSAPDSMVSRLVRRDDHTRCEWFYLCLDPYDDDLNGYWFRVNPAGVMGDAVMYNDGNDDLTWDAVWEAAARTDDRGWTLEMAIPFAQISFPVAPRQVWGINVKRDITRYNERDDLFHLPRGTSGFVSRFPTLVGIEGVRPRRSLELLPYVVGRAERLETATGDPFHDGEEFAAKAGLDLKHALSSDLTLTATFNPDFGQVEVDPAVVNLSDSETFFQEKRPFFVKDTNLFRFGREGTSGNWNFNWMDPMLFYSRRVGRSPQVSLPDHDHAAPSELTTILGAAKISGKAGAFDVGLMTAMTAEERRGWTTTPGTRGENVVEPLTSYSVLRLKRSSADGGRGLGFMATSTWRDLTDDRVREQLVGEAFTGGVDGWVTLDEARVWAVRGFLSGSYLHGSAAAVDAVQRSPVHYFQRPDAPHVDYDPTRNDLAGWAGRVMLNKQSGNVTLNTSVGAISPGYELNDVGFQYQADKLNWHLAAGRRWLEPRGAFRHRSFNLASFRTWDYRGRPDNEGHGIFWNVVLTNYWAMGGQAIVSPERNYFRATRGGPLMTIPPVSEVNLWFDTDSRKQLYLNPSLNWWSDDVGGSGWRVGAALVLKPSDGVELALEPSYQWFREPAQYVTARDDVLAEATGGRRYLFGSLDYDNLALAARMNWSFSPRMTLQAYLQPLVAVGRYGGLKEFARPGTFEFTRYGVDGGSTVERDDDGDYVVDPDGPAGPAEPFTVDDPDFNLKSLKINVVFRWEWRRGSTLFLVWTQDRTSYADPGSFDLGRDARTLVEAPGDDIVMAKFTWWLDL